MNDQHPHAGYAGYDGHSTGGFDSDPLFGSLPGGYDASYDTTSGYAAPYDSGQAGHSGTYDSSQWDTGAHRTAEYGHTADYTAYTGQPQPQPYDAGQQYDTGATWIPTDGGYGHTIPAQHGDPDSSGQWDTTTWQQNGQWADTGTTGHDTGAYEIGAYDTGTYDTGTYDTGAYDATAWNTGAGTGATPEHEQQTAQTSHTATVPNGAEQTTPYAYGTDEAYEHQASYASYDPYEPYRTAEFSLPETGLGTEATEGTESGFDAPSPAPSPSDEHARGHEAAAPDSAPAGNHRPAGRPVTRSGGGSRSRRRSPAKRSALLTVAVPSACVMSVAGIAAASVGGMGGGEEKKDETTTMAAADPGTVKPVAANNKLDTQLANLSADAENFADRASRTQERIDLKARQVAEKKKRADEAARKEALRPKFVMPVKQHGLSAYFGQAGVNWMSVHTGIDFPVDYGTPVMSATDGTVRTQFNTAYGNMAIVTAADGTETWYCHLSSTRIRSGSVKAGDVIAHSGDSGNSTGPHLHFEVRPGGGAAIDPLPWLRSHNINPN
ncbi:peptidoglycan DD-metalloendopeptidase family protein [Streptomyces sp. NPDC050421]|uniref:peptidoglycan DD-metalloendopeptidase family protein n=1 Tax=Streptomyces sp. NPDC050421 TaxID=3365613 RepID=UPI0037A78B5E